ncbi:MAG: hypothetical protein WDA14_03435 [Sphaerochaetaceae bacterium]
MESRFATLERSSIHFTENSCCTSLAVRISRFLDSPANFLNPDDGFVVISPRSINQPNATEPTVRIMLMVFGARFFSFREIWNSLRSSRVISTILVVAGKKFFK